MTRIAVGGFLHETNTFAPTKATYDDFVHGGGWPSMAVGADLLKVMRKINVGLAGFVEAAEANGWAPGSPPIADEWSVEAREGGVCVVRVVHSLFASTDDWDNQLEGTESGWPGFFRILRIYLTHFRGQRSAMMQWMAPAAGTEAEAWETLTAALGLKGLSVGQHCTAPAGAPALSGVAEYVTQNPYDALLRIDKPGPGVAAFGAFNFGGQSMVALNFYHYGDQAAGTAARETPLWDAWIQERFPTPSEPSQSE